jgi:hypothetical protein
MNPMHLHVLAEGQTEMMFAQRLLGPHLRQFGVETFSRCVLTGQDRREGRTFRGGMTNYAKAKDDIVRWLKERNENHCRFTTMFDLYALPSDFPGCQAAQQVADPYSKVRIIEDALRMDIGDRRFLPYVQLHEFEALILADPRQLDWEYLEHETSIKTLIEMVQAEGGNPETINDGAETAPSKRIGKLIAEYDKVMAGNVVVEKIGLDRLRQKCRHFGEWLTRLEQLPRS